MMQQCKRGASGGDAASLEAMAAEAVRLGRELAVAAPALGFGLGGSGAGGVARSCFANWLDGQVFEGRDAGALEHLGELLDSAVVRETLGSVEVIRGMRSNDRGEDELIVEREPRYSDHGEALLKLRETHRRFLAAREVVLDRLRAEREVMRLMTEGVG